MLNQLIITKYWVDIDMSGRSLHTFECKDAMAKKIQNIQWT